MVAGRTTNVSAPGATGNHSMRRAQPGSRLTAAVEMMPYAGRAASGSGGSSKNFTASRAWPPTLSSGRYDWTVSCISARGRLDPDAFGDNRHLGHVLVGVGVAQRPYCVPLVGREEAVDLGDVHPPEQPWVACVVRATVGGDAGDPSVDLAHAGDHRLGLGGGAVGRDADIARGALQTAQWIVAIVGVIRNARHGERVQGLQEQRTKAADEHGRVGVHAPGGACGAEQAGVDARRVVHRWRCATGEHEAHATLQFAADVIDGVGRLDHARYVTGEARGRGRRAEGGTNGSCDTG